MKRRAKKIYPIIFLLLFLFTAGILSQQDTLQRDSLSVDTTHLLLKQDTLLQKSSSNEIVIPYRASTGKETYPASQLYSSWHHEFLTPASFPKSAIPDTFNIDLKGFEFPAQGKVTSSFGKRSSRQHYGVDLKIAMKDTIRAAFSGKVRIERYEPRGYGYYIVIRHPNGLETIYGHLAKFLVKVNQYVVAGEPIALGGNTGRSSGPHLHFETRFMGNPINPGDLIDFTSNSLLSSTYTYTKNKKIVRTTRSSILTKKK
ncbi:MAG: M23 family metallopeptidase [Bacteroidales bacterium]